MELLFHWTKFRIKDDFNKCEWYEVYDLIEFTQQNYGDEEKNKQFREACNRMLELNLSAYRFVSDKIVEITSKEEILEIESALQIPISPVQEHINRSLELFLVVYYSLICNHFFYQPDMVCHSQCNHRASMNIFHIHSSYPK